MTLQPNTQITPETVGMLKACPFCGGEAEVMASMGEHWVRCLSCGASAGMWGSEASAKSDWNRRPAASSPSAVDVGEVLCTACEGKPSGNNIPCAVCGATPTPAPVDWQVVGPKLAEALEDAANALLRDAEMFGIRGHEQMASICRNEADAARAALAAATPGRK